MTAARMKMPLAIVLVAALAACAAAPARTTPPAARGCPPEHAAAREMVVAFLDAPAFADDAAAVGAVPDDTLRMRLLTAPADAEACTRLWQGLARGDTYEHPYLHSFYRLRGHYLIGTGIHPDAGTRVNPDGTLNVRMQRSFVTVVDASTFEVVGAYAL